MAGPITWRNVGSTVSPNVSSLTAGTTGLQQALGTIGKLIEQQQKIGLSNYEATKNNNTQNYLDQVANASVDQLSNPEFVAQLEAQRAQQGAAIDRNATRNAVLEQRGIAQDATIKQQQFADKQAEVDQRGIVDQLRTLAATGNNQAVDQILAEQQLINEGDIRKELASVYDNLQQREYRAAGEQRANEAADRAAESHALSMTAGRENLEWARETRADVRKERQDSKLGASIVEEVVNSYDSSRQATNELMRGVASELGLPTGEDGLPDQSKMDQGQIQAYTSALKESGAQANLSATEERQEVLRQLKNAGLTPAAEKQAISQWEVQRNLNSLAPEDKAKAEAAVLAANAGVDRIIENVTKDYQRESGRNPFIEPSMTPLEDVKKIMSGLHKEGFGSGSNRRSLENSFVEWTTNGIQLKDGSTRVVPTSLLELAVNSANRGFIWDSPSDIENRVIDLMSEESMIKMANEAPSIREEFLNEVQKLNNEKIANAVKVTRSAEAKKGVTINSNDILSTVLNRRN